MATFNERAGENGLLAALPRQGRLQLLAGCERVELRSGEVLCKAGARIDHVHFPTDSIVSLMTALGDGARLEVGVVGHEGMLGTSLVLGVGTHPQRAVVQAPGSAWRMSTATFQWHLRESIELRRLLNRYVAVLMGQLAQATACSHYHLVRARLASRLLMTRDRTRGNQFDLTQESLAHMLGVRRVGVTHAARSLREEGLIDYRRGGVTILDDAGLEQASCACYRAARDMYDDAFKKTRSPRHLLRAAPG